LARARFIHPDLRLLPSQSGGFDPGQLTALNALSNAAPLILLAIVNAVVREAILDVMLLLINILARIVQPALDSSSLLWRELAAGPARARFTQPDSRLLSAEPCGFNSGQFAAANALSNSLPLILLAFIHALRKAGRRDYYGRQRRHREPFHESLHWLSSPWPAA
jgi:hypothetical protein